MVCQKIEIGQWNTRENQATNWCIYNWLIFLNKGAKTIHQWNKYYQENWICPFKRMKLNPHTLHIKTIHTKAIQHALRRNIRHEIIKLLEENSVGKFRAVSLWTHYSNIVVWETRIYYWNLYFCNTQICLFWETGDAGAVLVFLNSNISSKIHFGSLGLQPGTVKRR